MIVVYAITEKSSNKQYIGSTQQYEIRKRRHCNELKQNKHHCINLQSAWNNRIGKFSFKILKKFKSRIRAYLFEAALINELMQKNKCFNVLNGGKGGDALTYNPNRRKIVRNITQSVRTRIANMSEKERKAAFVKYGNKNPNWRGGCSISYCACGNEKARAAKTCSDCRDRTGKQNPFFGKTHSDETKKKLREFNLGKKPANSNKISINGKIFQSQADAAKTLNVCIGTISFRLKSNNPKFKDYFAVKPLTTIENTRKRK